LVNAHLTIFVCIHRHGPACPAINVLHFKAISPVGPKLFVISLDTLNVFYHHATTNDISIGQQEIFDFVYWKTWWHFSTMTMKVYHMRIMIAKIKMIILVDKLKIQHQIVIRNIKLIMLSYIQSSFTNVSFYSNAVLSYSISVID
jgi:hypothetical protein